MSVNQLIARGSVPVDTSGTRGQIAQLQQRNALMQREDEEDAQFDAALAAGDFDTAMRIDPQTTQLYMAHKKQERMSGLGDIPITAKRIDEGAIQDQYNEERKFAATQRNSDRSYNLQLAQERRLSSGGGDAPKPQLVDVAQEDGTTQKQWLRPGETQGPSVGVPSTGQQLSPKDTNTARVKLNQVKIARAALQRVKDRWQTIQGGATAGPLQGYIPSEGGKAFDAATNAMRGSITALTRVPGVGAMSDYETRLDQSKFPERTSYESVTADQIQGLEDLLNNVESGYQEMLGTKPAAPKGAPKPGDNVKGYIFIGGNPADKSRWVKAK
jgi:hypothetical protein